MKRPISILLLISMFMSIIFVSGVYADETTNLLLGGTATASSEKNGLVAANANDGSESTYWRTNSATTSTLTIALSQQTPVDRFVVKYITGTTGGRYWRDLFIDAGGSIRVSAADDAEFTSGVIELGEIPVNQEGFVFEATLKAVSKKAVRFTFLSDSRVEVIVNEVEAYYTGAPLEEEAAAIVNLAAQQGARITGSSENKVWMPEKVIDGLTDGVGAAWQTVAGDETAQLTVDFGKAVSFSEWNYTNMVVPDSASGNAVESFVLEAANDAEFVSDYQLLYEGGPVKNNDSSTISFSPVNARYFRFRVLERNTNSGLRIYEMVIPASAKELRQAAQAPTVYVPADTDRVYKVGGVEAYDAQGGLLGTNPEGSYSLVQGLGSVSVCAVNGNLTVPAGTPSGTVRVKADFSGKSFEYDVIIDGDFEGNQSLHPSYVVRNPQISGGIYQIEAMTLSESAAQELIAIAVVYTDESKTTVETIQTAEPGTLEVCEMQELSFHFEELPAGRSRIFLWNGLTALQPVCGAAEA